MPAEAFGWPDSTVFGPDGFPWEPVIWTGGVPQEPLAFSPCAEIECPDAQRLFPFELPVSEGADPSTLPPSLGQLRMFGQLWHPAEDAPEAREVPDAVADDKPYGTNERLEWFDQADCIDVASNEIAVTGRVWELARIVVHRYNLVTIERIGYRASVTALDDQGDPLATFILDGEDPCAVPLTHPDPAVVNPLGFRFLLQINRLPSSSNGILPPLLVGAAPNLLPSDSPVLSYPDIRFGWREGWPNMNQFTDGGRSLVRFFVTLAGDPNRWELRQMGRLSGYQQQPGRTRAAQHNANARL